MKPAHELFNFQPCDDACMVEIFQVIKPIRGNWVAMELIESGRMLAGTAIVEPGVDTKRPSWAGWGHVASILILGGDSWSWFGLVLQERSSSQSLTWESWTLVFKCSFSSLSDYSYHLLVVCFPWPGFQWSQISVGHQGFSCVTAGRLFRDILWFVVFGTVSQLSQHCSGGTPCPNRNLPNSHTKPELTFCHFWMTASVDSASSVWSVERHFSVWVCVSAVIQWHLWLPPTKTKFPLVPRPRRCTVEKAWQ